MRDREEQVNYEICKTAHEASYDNEVKKTKIIPEGTGRGETTSIVKKGLETRRVTLRVSTTHKCNLSNHVHVEFEAKKAPQGSYT